MLTIEFSGYPLTRPHRVTAEPDDIYHGEPHYVLDRAAALSLAHAWQDAPGQDDVARAVEILDDGTLITALHLDHEITISVWQPEDDDNTLYSTGGCPFTDFLTISQPDQP